MSWNLRAARVETGPLMMAASSRDRWADAELSLPRSAGLGRMGLSSQTTFSAKPGPPAGFCALGVMTTPPAPTPACPPVRQSGFQATPQHAHPASRAGETRLGAQGRGIGYACSLHGQGRQEDGGDARTSEDRLAIGHTPVGSDHPCGETRGPWGE